LYCNSYRTQSSGALLCWGHGSASGSVDGPCGETSYHSTCTGGVSGLSEWPCA
jgi:hypothetical protein